VYLDNTLATDPDDAQHLESFKEVLNQLENAGLRLKKEKCHFIQQSVKYLGYRIDVKDKLQAIQSASNVITLKSYLDLLTYYDRFLATVLVPLY